MSEQEQEFLRFMATVTRPEDSPTAKRIIGMARAIERAQDHPEPFPREGRRVA